MKKLFCLVGALVLAAVLPLTAAALEQPMSVTAESADGLIYVTVALTEPVEGTTLGVSSSFDTGLLQAEPGQCQWKVQGMLSDFNEDGYGVWTATSAMSFAGDVVVLAFRPLSDEAVSTEISCTLIVKNGAREAGRFTAAATVAPEKAAAQPDYGWILWPAAAVVAVAVGGILLLLRRKR